MQHVVVSAEPHRRQIVGLLAVWECTDASVPIQSPRFTDFDEPEVGRERTRSAWPQCLDALERELTEEDAREEKNPAHFLTPLRARKRLSPILFFSPL